MWLAAKGCGLPLHIRRRHLLLMLKAFTDDSGSDPKSTTRGPVFVMAGYLADIDERSVSMILRRLPGEFSEQSITLAPWGLEG